MRCGLLIAALFGFVSASRAQELPSELAAIPSNALGFVHVRTHDLWNSPLFKMYRDGLVKAGPDAVKLIEERISPSPGSVDRAAVFAIPSEDGRVPVAFAVVLHLTKDVDEKKALGDAEPLAFKTPAGGSVTVHATRTLAIRILDKRTVAVGVPEALVAAGSAKAKVQPFVDAVQEAASGKKTIVAAGNLRILPPQAFNDVPPPIRPLFQAETAKLALTLGKEAVLEATLTYEDKEGADRAEQTVEQLREMGKALLAKAKAEAEAKLKQAPAASLFDFEKAFETIGPVMAIGSVKQLDELLEKLPIRRAGASLTATVPIPEELQSVTLTTTPILIALLVPAVQKVREAAARAQDTNNLKQMVIAMHAHYDAYKQLPPPASSDKKEKALLSWRVAILPFIEQNNLYQQFKLDEPWDSEHNKKLIPLMPEVYKIPTVATAEGMTHYQVVVGSGPKGSESALFAHPLEKVGFAKITDGTSNTLMIVQGEKAVPWTKPDDVPFDPKGAPPRLYRHPYGYVVALGDGSVRILAPTIRPQTLRALITRNGGEDVNPDER